LSLIEFVEQGDDVPQFFIVPEGDGNLTLSLFIA
jgi:hypothetical protein